MPIAEIRVVGLRECQRALAQVDKQIAKQIRGELQAVGEVVKTDAERRAEANIRNLGGPWGRMRIGVTRNIVYLAPKAHRKAGHSKERWARPNLRSLLADRAMVPAVEENQPLVRQRLDMMLTRIGVEAGF